jgi:hypothetical protein
MYYLAINKLMLKGFIIKISSKIDQSMYRECFRQCQFSFVLFFYFVSQIGILLKLIMFLAKK